MSLAAVTGKLSPTSLLVCLFLLPAAERNNRAEEDDFVPDKLLQQQQLLLLLPLLLLPSTSTSTQRGLAGWHLPPLLRMDSFWPEGASGTGGSFSAESIAALRHQHAITRHLGLYLGSRAGLVDLSPTYK
ncbi:hypothetical protein E4U42_001023 [Claviceps africana]|uniref:Uncharacterized protein n=1 Tax=Claviceps africana TaxID=83212 RepID=A0A8K0NJQ9_9HYPO|nr:hypothetical protein E4U42_001023 [Claviceps africana]